ncbi:pyridoxine kinase [Clostridiales Family XIII bacterium PM5-7]
MSKQILLINDIPGYGKVALSAMVPVLTHMGHNLYNLPTALVSNTLDYGKFNILDTTEYMKKTISVWKELGFSFDVISTGFIVSDEQARLVVEFCQEHAKKGTPVFVDPIMGDNGSLYNGITEETISHMRKLVRIADCVLPNYTEAAYLAGVPYVAEGQSKESLFCIVDKLREIGAKSVVITSAKMGKQDVVVGYDHTMDEYFILPFEAVPVSFPGTGDLFSAIFLGKVLDGKGLQPSTKEAMNIVKEMIALNQGNEDKFKGIPIETYLHVIK